VLSTIDPLTYIELEEVRTCIDTFVPDREAADCEFFAISARVSLGEEPER
jgi:hypothetical protein